MFYTIFAQKNCGPCQEAREFLYSKGETYIDVIYIDKNPAMRKLLSMAGLKTTPQVFSPKGEHIGGWNSLYNSLSKNL